MAIRGGGQRYCQGNAEGGPQGLFPDHGAEIYVVPFAAVRAVVSAGTMAEWISRNITPDHGAVSIKRLSQPRGDESAPGNIVEVEADFQRGSHSQEEPQHETSYYFTLRGAMFRLRLSYWKGDPRSAKHRSACLSILQSIRAIR